MAEERRQEELEEDCVRAFTSGNKLMAEQLLPRIPLPAVRAVTTMFKLCAYQLYAPLPPVRGMVGHTGDLIYLIIQLPHPCEHVY